MFEGKEEIFAQLLAFGITTSVLAYVSRTTFGLTFALVLGILAIIITHFAIRGETPLISVKISLLRKISTYNLLAMSYAVLLILLLSAHMLGVVSRSLVFFQEWSVIPIQNYILLLASIGTIFFLPGYFILRLVDRNGSIGGLDALVFSFPLSYLYTPVIGLISILLLGEFSATFYLLISLLFLGTCVFISSIFWKNLDAKKEDANVRVDPILLSVIIAFFVAALAFSKDYGYIGGDIWRHQGTAISIIRYGSQAVRIPLNWFHIGLVSVFTLPGFPITNSTLVLNLLNIMPILAFYCMARKIFEEKSQSMPAIATMFFSLFSGFGWIYALHRMQIESWTNALDRTASITANDTLFSNLWIWGHNPFVVGFIAFFMLLYLLLCPIKRERVIFTLTLLTFLTGWSVHVAEVLIFVITLGIILLFCQSVCPSRKFSVCLALIVGLLATLIVIQLSPGVVFFTVGFRESLLLLGYLTVTTSVMFASQKMADSFKKVIAYTKHSRIVHTGISMLILFLWLSSFYLWVNEEATLWNLRSMIGDAGIVPWYVYPMRLGIVGFFALLALLFKDNIHGFSEGKLRHFATFLILAVTFLILGKIITVTRVYYLTIDYWEIRILRYFLHAVVSVIAAMFTLYLFNIVLQRIRVTHTKKRAFSLRLLTAIFLASLIVVGTMSTVFTIDYWADRQRRAVTKDLGIATFVLDENTLFAVRSELFIGITSSSADTLDRLGVKRVSDPMRGIIASSSNAETYYFGTWFTEANYLLYMPEFDDYILKSNQDSFIYTNILQLYDSEYKTNETAIYRLPYGVPPTPDSEVLFLLPTGSPYTFVLDAFAQANISYTVASPNALTNINYSTIVLPYDPPDTELSQKLTRKAEEGTTLVIFNVDNLGSIAEKLNLIRKSEIAPIEPVTSWEITIGEGQINATPQDEQPIMNVSGQTDTNGMLRVDYTLQDSLDVKDAISLFFKFNSNQNIQSVRFALFDGNNNFQAYTLPYSPIEMWKNFELKLNKFTETSPSMNLSSIHKLRIGINGDPNTPYDFRFSGIEIISKPQNTSSNSITYKEQTLPLPSTINVPILNMNYASAFYLFNNTPVSPLITQENYGSGRIIYVNALPLLDNKKVLLEFLPKILPWTQEMVDFPQFNWTQEDASQRFEMYTKKIVAQGSININSTSLAPINGIQLDGQALNYSNIHFSINATYLEITPNTNGAYSKIAVSGPFDLLIFDNGQLHVKYAVNSNCTFLVKDPQVAVLGETQLEYAYWRKNAGHWGRTMIFHGDTTFKIYYSNIYLLLFDFQYNGAFSSLAPYLEITKLYPELEQVSITLYLSIAVIIIIIISDKVKKTQNAR